LLDAHTDAKNAALKVAEVILSMPGADADELEAMLHEKLDVRIIAAQGAKALTGDTKAASFFLQRGDAIRDQRRRERNRRREPHANVLSSDHFMPQVCAEPPIEARNRIRESQTSKLTTEIVEPSAEEPTD
jgi:hypothetical protein